MRFSVYKPKQPLDDFYITLIEDKVSNIIIIAICDDNGNILPNGTIAYISQDGIEAVPGLGEKYGFPLDNLNRIIIHKEE